VLDIQESLEQAYRECMLGNYFSSDPQKRGKFSFKYLRYVNVFLSNKKIEVLFRNCRTADDIHQTVTAIKKFVDSKLVRQFTAENFQDLIKIHYNSVNSDLLHDLFLKCQCKKQTVTTHLIPATRRTIELKIIQQDFKFIHVLDDFLKLKASLDFIKYSFSEYLSNWFKIQQPWEAEGILQNHIAQKNIRTIFMNIKLIE
jgi:hypothetical protein